MVRLVCGSIEVVIEEHKDTITATYYKNGERIKGVCNCVWYKSHNYSMDRIVNGFEHRGYKVVA